MGGARRAGSTLAAPRWPRPRRRAATAAVPRHAAGRWAPRGLPRAVCLRPMRAKGGSASQKSHAGDL